MSFHADTFCVGVQCFLLSNNSLLLGLRTAGFGAGTWGLPGGHLEKGETIFQTAKRELLEETGIVADHSAFEILVLGDPIPENNFHLQVGVLVKEWDGLPTVVAPNELGELRFFALDALPAPLLISSEYIIRKFLQKHLY